MKDLDVDFFKNVQVANNGIKILGHVSVPLKPFGMEIFVLLIPVLLVNDGTKL